MMDMPPRRLAACVVISCVTTLFLDQYQRNLVTGISRTKRRTTQSDTSYYQQDDNSYDYRPPLSDLIGDNDTDIKANVQSLLDFALIGHPKTATTFHLNWLHGHEQVQAYNHELHSLQQGKPAELVSQMYALSAGKQYKRGYKAPRDIMNPKALRAIAKFWPETKLVVGLRSPILWFQVSS